MSMELATRLRCLSLAMDFVTRVTTRTLAIGTEEIVAWRLALTVLCTRVDMLQRP